MGLDAELERIAAVAGGHAAPGEELVGVIATEPTLGSRIYLCAFQGKSRQWLALDDQARPVDDRLLVRAAVSIAALCELAEESAGGGKLEDLRADLVSVRLTEQPEGIDEAEAAALALERALGHVPRLASPEYLDAIGNATRRLEQALGETARSPFAEAMKQGTGVVEDLEREVLGGYKVELR